MQECNGLKIWRVGFSPRLTRLGRGVVVTAIDMYYVYILKSKKNNKLYKGLTTDLKRRFREHNAGNSKFTGDNRPWELLYYEAFINKDDAIREEKFLKSGKGRERIKYLFSIK